MFCPAASQQKSTLLFGGSSATPYGDHFFPHDIKVREFTSGKSRLNTLASLGIEAVVVPQYDELEGINVVRRMLGRTWIDPVRCERGLEALRGYRREYDERLRDWKKSPLHSWESHGADALRYFATGFDDTPSALAPRRRDSEPRLRGTGWAHRRVTRTFNFAHFYLLQF
jgi:phage terminase large subunit